MSAAVAYYAGEGHGVGDPHFARWWGGGLDALGLSQGDIVDPKQLFRLLEQRDYVEVAEALQDLGGAVKRDLHELWRRIAYSTNAGHQMGPNWMLKVGPHQVITLTGALQQAFGLHVEPEPTEEN